MATKTDFDRIGNYARMYNKDQNRNPRTSTRTVPMQVLALGFSRTGTLSMRGAFDILGYPNPYHFSSFYDNIQDCDVWLDLVNAKFNGRGTPGVVSKATFDGLLGHCGAVTDIPCHLFAAELIEFYPDAKIVLVERDLDSWFKSWSDFLDNAFSPALPLLAKFDPSWMGRIVSVGTACVRQQVGGATDVVAAKARSQEQYKKHYALVRSLVPKERILEYRLGDGWEPLCRFLGKEIPQVEFPHVNDSKANGQSFAELALLGMKHIARNATVITTVVAVPGFAVFWWMRARR